MIYALTGERMVSILNRLVIAELERVRWDMVRETIGLKMDTGDGDPIFVGYGDPQFTTRLFT